MIHIVYDENGFKRRNSYKFPIPSISRKAS